MTWPVLVDVIFKTSVALGAAAGASALLRRATASLRHLIWTLALAGALLVPAFSIALPHWELPLVTVTADAAPPAPAAAALVPIEAPAIAVPAPMVRRAGPDTAAAAAAPHVARSTPPAWPFDLVTTLVLLWAAGALLIVARLALGLLAVSWIARRTPEAADAPWLALARRLAGEVGLTRPVRFLRSQSASMPMACGLLRASVLMPADADGWPAARLRIVLLHELAHVKRRDCLTHVLAQIACAVHWFNPLVWVAVRRMRAERERACDDLVLAAGTRGSDYADQLIEIARVMSSTRFPAVLTGALAMAHRSQLEGRLMAILDPSLPRQTLTRIRVSAAATVFVLVLVPIATVQPWAEAADASPMPRPTPAAQPAPTPWTAAAPRPAPAPTPRPARQEVAAPAAPAQANDQPRIGDAVSGAIDSAVAESVQAATSVLVTQHVGRALSAAIAEGVNRGTAGLAATLTPAIVGQVAQFSRDHGQPLDAKTLDALARALNDADEAVRQVALDALARSGDPRTYDALLSALEDGSADVREKAVFGLGRLRDRRAIEPLERMLRDRSGDVREQAAFALGQLRDPSTIDALTAALHDSSADVREQAAFALGQIRDARAIDPLVSALKDQASDVREQAAFALGQIRSARAVEALTIALKDASPDVREQVAFALGQIRDPRAIEALTLALGDASAAVREQAAFALGQIAR